LRPRLKHIRSWASNRATDRPSRGSRLAITANDLDAAEKDHRVTAAEGDDLFVRTGGPSGATPRVPQPLLPAAAALLGRVAELTLDTRPAQARATQIARLAGDGLPNPEIAAPLFSGRELSTSCCATSQQARLSSRNNTVSSASPPKPRVATHPTAQRLCGRGAG
jgi:hypothetical protein